MKKKSLILLIVWSFTKFRIQNSQYMGVILCSHWFLTLTLYAFSCVHGKHLQTNYKFFLSIIYIKFELESIYLPVCWISSVSAPWSFGLVSYDPLLFESLKYGGQFNLTFRGFSSADNNFSFCLFRFRMNFKYFVSLGLHHEFPGFTLPVYMHKHTDQNNFYPFRLFFSSALY